ncbi:lipase family protein [uncultured Mucilaginibacter sp.]|uniref:alpha/beta hydrolase family protein n=1 Tax=uncultured Mucilaginibacter sp. TaxID=797541 RepID=UPI002617C48C|nr:lipase family protein [uncultured Mucilaginibacter sp.]
MLSITNKAVIIAQSAAKTRKVSAYNIISIKIASRIFSILLWVCLIQVSSLARAGVPSSGDLISSKPFKSPIINADGQLLIHYMPSIAGGMTRASTLLFVPKKTPSAGGWPIVAWAHGTATGGQKLIAPSLSSMLDGGLTKSGFISHYVFVIQSLVDAGYAVVAPDLEGLGAVASVPEPYFNIASSAQSLISGVIAARHANAHLSTHWAAVGHSEGGHGVLGVEAFTAEVPNLTLECTVAYAPNTSIAATVAALGDSILHSRAPKALNFLASQNFNVGLMATGLRAQSPTFDFGSVMGNDLRQLMPVFVTKGSVKIIGDVTKAIASKTPAVFSGFKANWNTTPEMSAFLTANDPAAMPGFNLRVPALIVQGTADAFVLEPLDAALTSKLIAAGDPVTYHTYQGKDHFTIIPAATPEVLAFLARYLR